MTPQQWEALQVGDTLMYTGDQDHTKYIGTVCEIIGKDSLTSELTLKIITHRKNRYLPWGNCSIIANGWFRSSACKFTLHSATPTSLSERINKKIKALDDKWAQSQAKKGNKYALLLL